jgi:hypothetical protein
MSSDIQKACFRIKACDLGPEESEIRIFDDRLPEQTRVSPSKRRQLDVAVEDSLYGLCSTSVDLVERVNRNWHLAHSAEQFGYRRSSSLLVAQNDDIHAFATIGEPSEFFGEPKHRAESLTSNRQWRHGLET